jgi:hypothetical protein
VRVPFRFWRRQERACWIAARGLLAGSCLVTVTAAAAAPERVSAQLVWNDTVCAVQGFASRVAWRTRHVRFVEHGEQLRFELGIERDGARLVASVAFAAPGQALVRRQITSPDCNDALDALALVVAIGVDERWRALQASAKPAASAPVAARGAAPTRKSPPGSSPEPSPEPAATVEAAAEPEAETPAPEAPKQETPSEPASPAPAPPPTSKPAPAPLPPPGPVSAAPARLPNESSVRPWSIGVSAQALSGVAPSALFGAELWMRARWERGSLWSPELGLSAGYALRNDYARADGKADFGLGRVSAELCPLRIGSAHFESEPCASAEFGSFRAAGHDTFRPQSDARPWGSLGVDVQGVAHWGWFELRALAGVSRPLTRDSFRFAYPDCGAAECGDGSFHRVASWIGRFALGAGVRFR